MKTFGIIATVIGGINFFMGLIGAEPILVSSGMIWLVIGLFCISKANKKEQEKKDKDNWINNN